jgi:hypothetical protein
VTGMLSKKPSQIQCRGIKKKFLSIEIFFSIIFGGGKVGVLFNCNKWQLILTNKDLALLFNVIAKREKKFSE